MRVKRVVTLDEREEIVLPLISTDLPFSVNPPVCQSSSVYIACTARFSAILNSLIDRIEQRISRSFDSYYEIICQSTD